jgi:hypothetical protein
MEDLIINSAGDTAGTKDGMVVRQNSAMLHLMKNKNIMDNKLMFQACKETSK